MEVFVISLFVTIENRVKLEGLVKFHCFIAIIFNIIYEFSNITFNLIYLYLVYQLT